MSRVIVRGGGPGMIRVELEGTDTAIDVDSHQPAYTALQAVQPFMQALADSVPVVASNALDVAEAKMPSRPSKAPSK